MENITPRKVLNAIIDAPLIRTLRVRLAIKALRRSMSNLNLEDIESLVDFAFNFNIAKISITPMQVPYEIKELLKIIKRSKPKALLEIGTAYGGTLFLFCMVSDPEAIIISIDLPKGPFGGGYPSWRAPLYKAFARGNQQIYLLREDSHDLSTFEKVRNILNKRKLDVLFIDGDHSYKGVKSDFKMYSRLVKKGGLIIFHDIVPGSPNLVGGVPIFWNEIKHKFNYIEIVESWKQGSAGIGIIYIS